MIFNVENIYISIEENDSVFEARFQHYATGVKPAELVIDDEYEDLVGRSTVPARAIDNLVNQVPGEVMVFRYDNGAIKKEVSIPVKDMYK